MALVRRRQALHAAHVTVAAAVLLFAAGCVTPTDGGPQTTGPAPTSAPSTSGTRGPATTKASPTTTGKSTTHAVYEVNGSGTALTIDYDTGGTVGGHESNVRLPWRKEFTPPPGFELYQVVVVVAPNSTNCRIILDGKVVDEQRTSGHCLYASKP